MSNTDRVYRVALSYSSTKSFLELLNEFLTGAQYAHNTKRTRVESVRGTFTKLLGTLFNENQNDEKRADRNAKLPEDKQIRKYDSMHEMAIDVLVGNYVIESKVWGRFINGVASAIGYGDLPTTKEAHDAFAIIARDYEDNNSYIKLEMRVASENAYNARQEAPADTEAPVEVPADVEAAKAAEATV